MAVAWLSKDSSFLSSHGFISAGRIAIP
jgi:hypothetical protein